MVTTPLPQMTREKVNGGTTKTLETLEDLLECGWATRVLEQEAAPFRTPAGQLKKGLPVDSEEERAVRMDEDEWEREGTNQNDRLQLSMMEVVAWLRRRWGDDEDAVETDGEEVRVGGHHCCHLPAHRSRDWLTLSSRIRSEDNDGMGTDEGVKRGRSRAWRERKEQKMGMHWHSAIRNRIKQPENMVGDKVLATVANNLWRTRPPS